MTTTEDEYNKLCDIVLESWRSKTGEDEITRVVFVCRSGAEIPVVPWAAALTAALAVVDHVKGQQ